MVKRAAALRLKMTAYQRPKRTPKLRRNGSSRPENISNSPNGMEHSRVFFRSAAGALAGWDFNATLVQLVPKAMNQDIHDVGLRVEAIIEDVLEDRGFGDRAIRVTHEVFEQSEFSRLQFDRFAAAADFARNEVHPEVADREAGGF